MVKHHGGVQQMAHMTCEECQITSVRVYYVQLASTANIQQVTITARILASISLDPVSVTFCRIFSLMENPKNQLETALVESLVS